MNTNRSRDVELALVGVIALAAYVLACTSFSPDDKKVAFPAFDPKSGGLALAVYDREKRSTQNVFAFPKLPESPVLRAAWTADGRYVVAFWVHATSKKDSELNILALPQNAKEPVRYFRLAADEHAPIALSVPPAMVGSRMLLEADSVLYRLDFRNCEVRTNAILGASMGVGVTMPLQEQNGVVWYMRRIKSVEQSSEKRVEIGRLDVERLTPLPVFAVPEKPSDDFRGVFAVSRDGLQTALLCKRSEGLCFLIYHDKKLIRTIQTAQEDDEVFIGNFVFSRDGTSLYASYAKRLPESFGADAAQKKALGLVQHVAPKLSGSFESKERWQYGVLEVSLAGEPIRETPLFTAARPDPEWIPFWQLDLSHDGNTIALCSSYFGLAIDEADGIARKDVALYLVDLTRPDRRVRKVPIAVPKNSND